MYFYNKRNIYIFILGKLYVLSTNPDIMTIKKSHMNHVTPFFLLCVLYFAGVCVPVAGKVGTFSASVD